MSYTRRDLITRAIGNLGVVAEGQDLSDTEINKMDGIVNGAMAELAALEIFYVADIGEVGPTGGDYDDAAFLSLAAYLANAASADFNLAADEKLKALEQEAIARLRTLSRPPRARARLQIDPVVRAGQRGQYAKWPNNG
jgi:hypothetical protein